MAGSNNRSDRELIELCNSGMRSEATQAFDALYCRHKQYVLRVAYRYTADPDVSLDVLQDTFTWLLRQFPPPGKGLVMTARLRTLLYTITKNTAISALRKRKFSTDGQDPDDLAGDEVEPSDLGSLLRGLSPNEREIVLLRFVDDLTVQDIASTLDIPLGTAKSRLHKAVSSLRKSPYVKDFFEK